MGEYNINLDNKIVYGIDSEFDAARYYKGSLGFGTPNIEHDESIISQYFDYQFRPIKKLYASFGLRSDDHTTVGRKTSGRSSVAGKYSGRTRDFGNVNDGWRDQILNSYVVVDLVNSYQLFDSYKMNLNINNIFNEEYQQAWQYSTEGRSLSFGIKRVY